MAETVIMPKLGFDMAEGTLVRWVKQPGEPVAKGDVLAEIETDKATVEVESPYPGVVARQLVEEGAVVPVGDPIAVIGAEGEKVEVGQLPDKAVQEEAPATASGQAPAAAVDTSAGPEKAPSQAPAGKPAPAQAKGTAPELGHNEPAGEEPAGEPEVGEDGRVKASPLARKLARERGIDLSQVTGSGPGGRITRKDLEWAAAGKATKGPSAQPTAAKPAPTAPAVPAVQMPVIGTIPADSRVPLSRLRQAIGRRMVESSQAIPAFTVTRDFNVEGLVEVRRQLNLLAGEGEKLSYNDFIVKAAGLALRQFPNLNASLDGDAILQHGHVNVGVAVAVEGGLLTVVCKDADQKSVRQISAELRGMVARATSGKIKPEDVEGSTFSTSNLGMFGVDAFTAIINPPEAAILAVGGVRETPVVSEGVLRPGQKMKATLTADHRVTDGAEAARFMQALAVFIENPALMLV